MSLKDLFNRSSQLVVSSSAQKLSEDVESPEYIQEYDQEQNRIEPHIDFSDPANFSVRLPPSGSELLDFFLAILTE